jgi:hypothetical protein
LNAADIKDLCSPLFLLSHFFILPSYTYRRPLSFTLASTGYYAFAFSPTHYPFHFLPQLNLSHYTCVFCNPYSPLYALNTKELLTLLTDLSLQLVRSHMFRTAFWPFSSLRYTRSARTARYFHQVTTDFITYDARGNLVTRKVPIIVGNPEETYFLIEQGVGSALRAASPLISASVASAEDRCKLTFFHDSQYFGFGMLLVCESFI